MNRRERKRRRQRRRPVLHVIGMAFVVLFVVGGVAIAGVVGWIVAVADSAPSIDQLKPLDQGSNSVVYTHDGKRLGFINSLILRTPLTDSQIPPEIKQATVAIEDRRFYEHKGIDYEGVIRAALRNLTSQKTVQGGSTLTMQLVRNIYLPDDRFKRSFKRKIREAKLAEELENKHPGRAGKNWILDQYLNSVAYGTVGGQTAIGIGAASRMFFDKPASQLSLPQAALLAGLPQAPSEDNPFLSPANARARRAEVLQAMVKAHDITQAQANAAAAAPLGVRHNAYYTARREQFFFDYVTQELYRHYGVATVRHGGLKIYTTIDLRLQELARKAIAGQLNEPGDPASAIVAIDPRNGHILTMASSADYGKTKFNYATQAHRQPGSTFKVMVLMAALSRGVDPNSTTYDSHELPAGWLPGYPDYHVETYSHSYVGRINLVKATLQSDNTVYAQLDADIGPEAVRDTAYKLGITTHLDALPAEGLGGLKYGVSPLEMANAYATIADGGWRNTPIAILKVVHPDGRVDDLGKPHRVKVFSDGVTAEATKILEENIQSGTGTAANYGCPAGGKTGTTSDYKDAWFIGFEPQMATAVWVGYPNPPIPMLSVHGIEVAGATFPAQIWHDFMASAHGSFCGDFPPPQHPFVSSPFFGRYARTGTSGGTGYGNGYNTGYGNGYGGYTGGSGTSQATGSGGASSPVPSSPSGKGKYNDPSLYETPPQGTPPTGGGGGSPRSGGGGGGTGTTPGAGHGGGHGHG